MNRRRASGGTLDIQDAKGKSVRQNKKQVERFYIGRAVIRSVIQSGGPHNLPSGIIDAAAAA